MYSIDADQLPIEGASREDPVFAEQSSVVLSFCVDANRLYHLTQVDKVLELIRLLGAVKTFGDYKSVV